MRRIALLCCVLLALGCPDESPPGESLELDVFVLPETSRGGEVGAPDAPEPPPPDPGPDVLDAGEDPAAPIPWQPCMENADCASGWCVETADGRTCTRTCIDSCPAGFFCGEVSNTGADVTYICLPSFVTLCKPCTTDEDCSTSLSAGLGKCLSYGGEGSFCGAACSGGDDAAACPDGYACDEGQCRLEDGICACSWKAVKDAAKTTCTASSEHGTCSGERGCVDGKLSSCDAAQPMKEICDGVDNDCNGLGDEELPLEPCTKTNDAGTCTGVLVCTAGVVTCTAQEPKPELCDGLDNDCDSDADEGFPDSDKDGIADCMSEDDDGDGIVDGKDNCPLVANPGQEDMDVDGIGEVCDKDLDGDGDGNETDCAPADPLVGHLATEVCNAVDDDCDGGLDEGFPDLDGDGVADCVDEDDDGDGAPDVADNCPVTPNADQSDADGDGKGDACENDTDGDGDPDSGDCAKHDPTIHHGAVEACNGKDENCNGIIDEGYPDTDVDGVANCLDDDDDDDGVFDKLDNCPLKENTEQTDTDEDGAGDACDSDDDGDGDPDGVDCAPLDASVSHAMAESCNGKDDDCDGAVDEAGAAGCQEYLFDNDGDGFGLMTQKSCLCGPKSPFTASTGGDCNDQNQQVFPGATEICNGKDDDCDDKVDEGAATGCADAWLDGDKDGYGAGDSSCVCPGTPGTTSVAGDCDDAAPLVHPNAVEKCNGVDDNCDKVADEKNAQGCEEHYLDKDGDGYGVSGEKACLCGPTGKLTAPVGGDCNDNDAENFPTNPESCDEKDNNCNGQVDEGVQKTWFLDHDGDGYGASFSKKDACTQPKGHVLVAGDCNDFNAGISPGAAEVCNDIDDDCDGAADDGLATTKSYKDNDGDGFAAKNAASQDKCNVPVGWTLVQDPDGDEKADWDCDDSDVTVYPFAPTVCGDAKDNNCDGYVDRLCFTACPGKWPFKQTYTYGGGTVSAADLDGDGNYELVVRGNFGMSILDIEGEALYDYSKPVHNYARAEAVFADIDDYDKWGPAIQTLEVLTGDGSHPQYYKVTAEGSVTVYSSTYGVYDASRFMVYDLDYDGVVEFVTSTWCGANGSELFRFDRSAGSIVRVAGIDAPDDVCQYTDGRVLTDLDGDGWSEIAYGTGYSQNTTPKYWSGKIFAERFTDYETLATEPFCEGCFQTGVAGLFGGATHALFRIGGEVRASTAYFLTNVPEENNPSTTRYWRFDLDGAPLDGQPTTSSTLYDATTDLDDDGTPEADSYVWGIGLYDVNGDGYPDRVSTSGTTLRIHLWDPVTKKFVKNDGSDSIVSSESLQLGSVWDMNSDGRLEVATVDANGKVRCHQLGADTWNRQSSLPPHVSLPYRTFQWDNYEPNDGADFDGNGLPDRIARIPTALTAKGNFYGYLSTPEDEDYFLIGTNWGGSLCMTSPKGRNYTLHVYSVFDRWKNESHAPGADGKPDGLVWEDMGTKQTKCWGGSLIAPHRYGEYRFIVAVKGAAGSFSPYWPYWIDASM